MDCPRGHGALSETKVDELVVDRCGTCGGIWLDFAQLERVLSRESRALKKLLPQGQKPRRGTDIKQPDETVPCPRCAGTLLRMRLFPEPLHYYACLTCYGRWLDGEEIRRIIGQPLSAKFEALFKKLLD